MEGHELIRSRDRASFLAGRRRRVAASAAAELVARLLEPVA